MKKTTWTRLSVITASVVLALYLGGCRANHLGADTGKAYRKALSAQAEAGRRPTTPPEPGLDANDADRVLKVHRERGQEQGKRRGSGGSGGSDAAPTLELGPR